MKRVALLATAAAPVVATLLAGTASADDRTVTEMTFFTSPSGNISCVIDPDSVRCDIRDRTWEPPAKPSTCSEYTGWGQGLQLRTGRPASFVCAGDTTFGAGSPLAYGDAISSGTLQCRSEFSGMSCRDSRS